jgi:leucyl-tRNA synthetase
MLGKDKTIAYEPWPEVNEEFLKEDVFEYPVSFNGRLRFKIDLPVSMSEEEITEKVLTDERAKKWLATGIMTKIIVVPNRIVNVVIKN